MTALILRSMSRLLVAGLFLTSVAAPALAQRPEKTPPARPQTPDAPPPDTTTPPDSFSFLGEPHKLTRAIDFVGDRFEPSDEVKNGFYPELGYMITGSGWISAGPGYRHRFLGDLAFVDASAAISWRAYKIAQARVEFRPYKTTDSAFAFGSQVFWQDATQIRYYGLGPDSSKSDKGLYRMRDVDVVGYAHYRKNLLTIEGSGGWLRHPSIDSPAGPFRAGFTDARDLFTETEAPGLTDAPPSFLHGAVNASIDMRNAAGYSTRGGLYRAGVAAYSDRDTGQFSFRRYDVEATQFIPLLPQGGWVLAMHGWLVGSQTSDGNTVPVYMLPSLGGTNTLEGYTNYRFHDRNLLLASVESRWALMRHVDVALFFNAGNVAPRVGDLNFDKRSIGVGLRVHTQHTTFGRLDIGHSKEGWTLSFKMDDPFGMSHRSPRMAQAPFVP
jgi:hypothetical protein